jgi:hypothetical protein
VADELRNPSNRKKIHEVVSLLEQWRYWVRETTGWSSLAT